MTESSPQESAQRSLRPSFMAPDPNDPDIIMPEVKLTRYDKAISKLRDLEAKRAALTVDHDPCEVATLEYQIDRARKAVMAAQDDVTRKREEIDEWRAGAGREVYNTSRRKKRVSPNAKLKGLLTKDQIKQRKLDQTADKKWLDRRRASGMPEAQIQAAYVVHIREREAKRAGAAQDDLEQAEMEALPHYGGF